MRYKISATDRHNIKYWLTTGFYGNIVSWTSLEFDSSTFYSYDELLLMLIHLLDEKESWINGEAWSICVKKLP